MNTVYTNTSKPIYDNPIHYDNLRLHPSGSVAVFSQFQVHYYDLVYEPRNLYNISWLVIRNGKDVGSSLEPTTKEEWLDQRHQRDYGLHIIDVRWLCQRSIENYSIVLLSNNAFFVLRKAYQNESPVNYVLDDRNLFMNRQQIVYDSGLHSQVGQVSMIRTNCIGNDQSIILTAYGSSINTWVLQKNESSSEMDLVPFFALTTNLALSWFDWIQPSMNTPDSVSSSSSSFSHPSMILAYDSSTGLFECHLIRSGLLNKSLSEKSAKKAESNLNAFSNNLSHAFGHGTLAGLKIQQSYFFESQNRLLLLSDSKALVVDLASNDSTVPSIHVIQHDLLDRQSLLCLNRDSMYSFDPPTSTVFRWKVSCASTAETGITIQPLERYVGDASFLRILGARVDPLNCCLLVSIMIPPTVNSREGQVNANLVHAHLQFAVVGLLPLSIDNNETMIQSLQQIIGPVITFPVTAIFFPLYIQRLIDYRKEKGLDILVPRLHPKQREAYEFGLQNEEGTRLRRQDEDDENEAALEEDEGLDDDDFDEDLSSDSEIEWDEDGEPLTKKPKKNLSSSGPKNSKKNNTAQKKSKKSKDDNTDGTDFVMNTIYQQLKATFGLDKGNEYPAITTLLLETIKRLCFDIKPLSSSAMIEDLLDLLTDLQSSHDRCHLRKILHLGVCCMIKFNRLSVNDYPWLLDLRRRIAEPMVHQRIQRGELIQEEKCQVCQTLIYLDINDFQETICPGCENIFDRCCFSLQVVKLTEQYKMCPGCGALGDAEMVATHIYCPFCDVQLQSPWYQ